MMLDKMSYVLLDRAYAADTGFFKVFTLDTSKTNGVTDAKLTFTRVVTFAMSWLLAIAALIAFVYLVLSGIKYITAGGDAAKATEARTGIINAIIGIVVIVVAWSIIRFASGLGSNIGSTIAN